MHKQVTNYLSDQNLLSDDQHGFRRQHSTTTALINMTDEILKGMDRYHITLLTLPDLSLCFDVTDHDTLLEKLQLTIISTGWFKSYLEGHVQQVNPRPAGPLDFPPPAGGCLNTPRLSRLLRILEQNRQRHSKAREKSFRNHFGHFLAQVKIEVTRGQNPKFSKTVFER